MFKLHERPQFQLHRPKLEFCQIKWGKQNIQELKWEIGSLSTKIGRELSILEQRLSLAWI